MRYPGGKGKCYQHFINLMPPHHTYIESHLGGGAVLRNKNPAKRNIGIDIDPNVIARWKLESTGLCELVEADAFQFLSTFSYRGDELVYVDPPYLPSTRRREKVYRFDYQEEQHEPLLKLLRSLPCMVMLSGYSSALYNDLLSDWNKVSFSAKTHIDVREEFVWLNFEPTAKLHDGRYCGSTFRERQTIKRRRARMYDRIQNMDPVERNELIKWLSSEYGTATGVA
jgi:DNA adenine methylase